MKTIFRDYQQQIEEGLRNIILQNRCGNRLTLMLGEESTELECLYKPNAFRRKDYRARNFSNRDNCTALFARAELPQIPAGWVKAFDYDPFVTALSTESPGGAKNRITVVNIADENCFALAARCPLVLTFEPHERFELADGLLSEAFSDRGEEIVSFVAFESFEENRFRVLDDGRAVLQIFENEVVLIGGEDSPAQVERVLTKLAGLSLDELIEHTEARIAVPLSHGRLVVKDEPLQRVLDINRRLSWSGLDAGGACFGAMNRIYHLIWTRDGSMAAATMARAGMPDMLSIWLPFLLANPSVRRDEAGNRIREFLQIVGSRWTKAEDDGIYYAVLSLFSHWQSVGDAAWLEGEALPELLEILDENVALRFDTTEGLFRSDTLGETTLASSPYYGYDSVNGQLARGQWVKQEEQAGKRIAAAYSLYHNVNLYNCLRMAQALAVASGRYELAEPAERYGLLAGQIAETLAKRFINDEGHYYSCWVEYDDASRSWVPFETGDYWEYAWAVSAGPFLPDPVTSLASARMALQRWPGVRSYGYCPWCFLARSAREYGLDSAGYRALLDEQITDALRLTQRYPMAGLLTEYQTAHEGWRGLPFGTGALVQSTCGLLLQPLPMGVAVRASDLAERLENFVYRTARLDVEAAGTGDTVAGVLLNGQPLTGSLQLPASRLRTGRNRLDVTRGAAFEGFRLYSSTAELRDLVETDTEWTFHFHSPAEAQLVLDTAEAVDLLAADATGRQLPVETRPFDGTDKTLATIDATGEFTLVARKK